MSILARDPTPVPFAAGPSPRALHSRACLSTMHTPVSARTYSAWALLIGSVTGSRNGCQHTLGGRAINDCRAADIRRSQFRVQVHARYLSPVAVPGRNWFVPSEGWGLGDTYRRNNCGAKTHD